MRKHSGDGLYALGKSLAVRDPHRVAVRVRRAVGYEGFWSSAFGASGWIGFEHETRLRVSAFHLLLPYHRSGGIKIAGAVSYEYAPRIFGPDPFTKVCNPIRCEAYATQGNSHVAIRTRPARARPGAQHGVYLTDQEQACCNRRGRSPRGCRAGSGGCGGSRRPHARGGGACPDRRRADNGFDPGAPEG